MTLPIQTWPRPSAFPICTFILLLVNSALCYWLINTHSTQWWGAPIYAMNIFFLWAERSIYLRDKRNFDGWRKEMAEFLDERPNWDSRVRSIERRRR